MPQSRYPMIPVTEAVEIVLQGVRPLPPKPVSFAQALGLVVAEDVYAAEPMPPFAASAVDGYAIIAADISPARQLIGEQLAGRVNDLQVSPGTAVRITTGAPIPPGADAVVMVEYTHEEPDGQVQVEAPVEAGDNVRPVGQDLEVGQLVLPQGTLLGAAEIGLLAMVGRTEVHAYPRPRIAVMSTGDELVEPGQPLKPGQIRDSNRFSLMSAVREAGGVPVDMGRIGDQPGAVQAALDSAVHEADAVLTAGGVSMGGGDLVKPYLEARGRVHFGRVRARPGKPVTFATLEGMPVFALPGFPVSALVCFEIYVRPALLRMAGHTAVQRPRRRVTLSHDIRHGTGRTEFQRAVVTGSASGQYLATTTGYQGSGRLLSLRDANALLVLSHEQEHFPAGTQVEALILGPVWNAEDAG